MYRPPGQIDAFVSSDEGSDMDVSESETDESTVARPSPFTAVAPSDYKKTPKLPKGGSFVSNMRNYAAEQAQDSSNHVTPRVEHFNNESNPIQIDSDSDNESICSFYTAPSSPTGEDNSNDELEKEMARITDMIEMNKGAINGIKAEVADLKKQKDSLNLKILQSKVRNSITTRKRTALREIPKRTEARSSTQGIITQPQPTTSLGDVGGANKDVIDSTRTIASQNKGKEKSYVSQQDQQRQSLPVQTPRHPFTNQNKHVATVMEPTTPKRIIVEPSFDWKNDNSNNYTLAQDNMEHAKETNLKRKAEEKQNQRNVKKWKSIDTRNERKAEKIKSDMNINRVATELAKCMALDKPPPTLQDTPMEEGELVDSSSSDDDNSNGGSGSVSDNSKGYSRNSISIVQTTPKNLSTNNIIPKIINTQTPPIQHTANRNNFQPYKSALSSIGLSAQNGPSVISSGNSEDRPLCTFEQNGGTCNNDSCQAAHFRDFI